MNCRYCSAPMVLATESRGLKTRRCSRGCDEYRYEEIAVQDAEPITCVGTIPSTHQESGQFAQTAAMT